MLSMLRPDEPVFFYTRRAIELDRRQDRHRGKAALCTAGTVGILIDLFSLLSVYNCPATSITAANIITNIALANCVTSLIPVHQISLIKAGIRERER
jgi:hypothetical protein